MDSREITTVDEKRTLSLQDDDLRNIYGYSTSDPTLKLQASNIHHQKYFEKSNETMYPEMLKKDVEALIYQERDIKETKDNEKFSESQKSFRKRKNRFK